MGNHPALTDQPNRRFPERVYASDAIPDSLIESGRLDGASDIGIFLRIGLRMLVPGIITVFLFSLVSTWNNYFLPLVMLNNPKLYPITVGLAQLNATANNGGGSQALFSVVVTGSLLSIIPLIAAFLLLQRFWRSGLSAGAVNDRHSPGWDRPLGATSAWAGLGPTDRR